jgi:acyl-CoA synthetase (NDP forming)
MRSWRSGDRCAFRRVAEKDGDVSANLLTSLNKFVEVIDHQVWLLTERTEVTATRPGSARTLSGVDRLRSLFTPRSIAVVGASETSSWARNLIASTSLTPGTGVIVPVNPKYSEQFGRPALPSLRELSDPVDLAFILVGPERVESVLEDAASVGIKNAVVLAGGYSEAGAHDRQVSLARKAEELDITVLGPNTIGYLNAREGFSPWAVATRQAPLAGPLGAVFESGSMARATFEFAQAHGVGSSIWASVGNGVVVDSLDVMELLVADDATRAIMLFLETIKDADRFLATTHAALEAGKPVVVFKAGRTAEGQRSAMAHTGALATNDAVVDAAFRQSGVVRAESLEELVATAGLFAYSKRLPSGPRMGVVTSSGGGCNIIADMAAQEELRLPEWSAPTLARLGDAMPPFASLLNPLDTTGYGHARKRARPTKAEDDLLELAAPDKGVDLMLTMMTPLPSVPPPVAADREAIEERLRIIGGIVADSPVPVFLSSNTCLDLPDYPRRLLAENDLYLLPGIDLGMRAIGHLARWRQWRDELLARPVQAVPFGDSAFGDSAFGDSAFGDGEVSCPAGVWAEDEGRQLLATHGVVMVPGRLVASEQEARQAFEELGGVPVAVKICSRDIAHKSDIGGVALSVDSAEGAARAYRTVLGAARDAVPTATVRGVLVSPMREPGVDLIVGVTSDPTFGPVLAVGLGGIWVEVVRDSALRILPVDADDVRAMVTGLRGAPLLLGGRGQRPVDLDSLCADIVRISDAALALGDHLDSLEINPLRVTGAGAEALDVLVTTVPGKE